MAKITLKEALNVDVLRLSDKELKEVMRTLASAGNKRLRRLEQSGLQEFSPAYIALKEGGSVGGGAQFTSAGDRRKLLQEYKRTAGFLAPDVKTANVRGARANLRQLQENFNARDMSPESISKLVKAYDKIKTDSNYIVYNRKSPIVMEKVTAIARQNDISKLSPEELADLVVKSVEYEATGSVFRKRN